MRMIDEKRLVPEPYREESANSYEDMKALDDMTHEEAADYEEHDGCDGCKYECKREDESPCTECCNNYASKWERRPKKTRQDEFLERYPDAALDSEGALKIAPCWIERAYSTSFCKKAGCDTCQRDYWLQEVEE